MLQKLGRIGNLAAVIGEVFGDMGDGIEAGHTESLNLMHPGELARR